MSEVDVWLWFPTVDLGLCALMEFEKWSWLRPKAKSHLSCDKLSILQVLLMFPAHYKRVRLCQNPYCTSPTRETTGVRLQHFYFLYLCLKKGPCMKALKCVNSMSETVWVSTALFIFRKPKLPRRDMFSFDKIDLYILDLISVFSSNKCVWQVNVLVSWGWFWCQKQES